MGYPVDISGIGTYAAYGLRRLRAAWAGDVMTVRRAVDGSNGPSIVVGFASGTDVVNLPAIAAALGIEDTALGWAKAHEKGNVAYVTSWYDQSGNGRNMGLPTATQGQPPVLRRDFSGLPCVWFETSGHLLNNWGNMSQPFVHACCGYHHAPASFLGGINDIFAGASNITMAPYNAYAGSGLVGPVTQGSQYTSDILGARHTGIGQFAGTGQTHFFNFDGDEYSSTTAGGAQSISGLQLNSITLAGARRAASVMHEYLVWGNGTSFDVATRKAVNLDIRTFYPSGPIELVVPGGSVFLDDY